MRIHLFISVAILALGCFPSFGQAPARQARKTAAPVDARAFLDEYCVTCHNKTARKAGLTLDLMDPQAVQNDIVKWEEVTRKLRGNLMPPPGMPRPAETEKAAFVNWLEARLDQTSLKKPDLGYVAVHRLNRTEYAAAVEQILGVKVDASTLLPVDDIADGFENIANVLKVSPSFLDQYIAAARLVSAKAVGTSELKPQKFTIGVAGGDQGAHVEGLPLGTRGGLVGEYTFPADGDYEFNFTGVVGSVGYQAGMEYYHRAIVTVDGEKVYETHVGGDADLKLMDQKQSSGVAELRTRFEKIKLHLAAGPHKIGIAFVNRGLIESDEQLQSFIPGRGDTRLPRAQSIQVNGPFNATAIGATPARQRIFVCRPPNQAEEISCAYRIFQNLAKQAYRRPATDQDVAAPLNFFKEARATGDFDKAIQSGVVAILSSPKFLYRTEAQPANAAPGTAFRITDLELASRLSFFLWSQNPDEQLLDLASANKLSQPAVLAQQVKRMLADKRSNAIVRNFAFQWLNMRNLSQVEPDPVLFSNFDAPLRQAFTKEIDLFIQSIITEDRSVLDLLNANYTFANERLALHYHIPNVRGSEFRRVTLADPNRWGLLGKGAVLMTTSYPNRTSSVLRGSFILERLMGTPPSPPPPNVEAFPETKEGAKPLTVRQSMEMHRKNPTCNACHGIMDPLGFALENYDAIGEWREVDRWAGVKIDSGGNLADGTPVSTPADLRKALTREPTQFVQTMVQKMMMYALGRPVDNADMPFVRQVVRGAAASNYKFSQIVLKIAESDLFQKKQAPEPAADNKQPARVAAK
jgi:mono/diheme cytochrome c family protein